jgi:hypothetical protein
MITITGLAHRFGKTHRYELTTDEIFEYWHLLADPVKKEIIKQHLDGKIYFRGNPIKIMK